MARSSWLVASLFVVACSSSSEGAPTPSNTTATPDLDGGAPIDDGGAGANDGGADDASPAAIPSSQGKGGLTCTRRDSLGGGREACVVKVGAVELKILEPKGALRRSRCGSDSTCTATARARTRAARC